MEEGIIFDVKKYAIHDGPGIRTTVFLKGCPLNCWWCHNPEGIDKKPERAPDFNGGFKLNDPFTQSNIIGEKVSDEDLFREILKDRIYYEESGGGVTFSGGEPLLQHKFLKSMLEKCKEEGFYTALDTTGYAEFTIISEILPLVDVFLYDLKIIDNEKHQKYTGVSNKKIIDNLKRLSKLDSRINLRVPIIPDITDTEENIEGMINLMDNINGICKVNLLPFHNVKKKYAKLDKEYKLSESKSIKEDELKKIKDQFETSGIVTEIGG